MIFALVRFSISFARRVFAVCLCVLNGLTHNIAQHMIPLLHIDIEQVTFTIVRAWVEKTTYSIYGTRSSLVRKMYRGKRGFYDFITFDESIRRRRQWKSSQCQRNRNEWDTIYHNVDENRSSHVTNEKSILFAFVIFKSTISQRRIFRRCHHRNQALGRESWGRRFINKNEIEDSPRGCGIHLPIYDNMKQYTNANGNKQHPP